MDTDVVLVRHGEAHCNLAGIAGGDRGCTGLTLRGRGQVDQAGRRLEWMHHDRQFDVVYAGPRRRVRETAAVISLRLGLTPHIEPRLSGPAHGDADGKPWTDIWEAFGSSPADQPDRPFAAGAESWNAFLARATDCLQNIVTRHAGERILILAHAETVEAMHTLLLGLPAGSSARVAFTVAHASLTRWVHRTPEIGSARWTLVSHNDTAHLIALPTTGFDDVQDGDS
ncbi:histidine phosphatase family protein [Frankia sp. CgMI4]|uniref:histidine phosphatase family protein n=1 Tax=Frankia sp. CgMI4 TaxID=1742262 RepID=UPI0020C7F343|nr:histidine phosphatase family protein [Frankia sp. CgIM4]